MSIWFVVTAPNETVLNTRIDLFKATYLGADIRGPTNPDNAEAISRMVRNADNTAAFTGSTRVDSPTAQQVGLAHAPWLFVHETPDFMDTWVWPEMPV
jgi:hypothetical protein